MCLLDCFLTFCLKKGLCQNNNKNKFEKRESSGWKGLNGKIGRANDIKVFLYRYKCGKVRIRRPVKKHVVRVI